MEKQNNSGEIKFYLVLVSGTLLYILSVFYLVLLTRPTVHIGDITFNTDVAFYFNGIFLVVTVLFIVIFENRIKKNLSSLNRKTKSELFTSTDKFVSGTKFFFLILVFSSELMLTFLGIFILVTN